MGGDECLVLEAAVTCQSSIVTKAADAVFGELGTSNARWREDVSRNAKLWFLVVKSVAASCALFSPRDGGSDAIVHMLATAGACRRQGYAATLVRYLRVAHAQLDAGQVFVEVSAASDARSTARLFWDSEGFTERVDRTLVPKLFTDSILLATDVEAPKLADETRGSQEQQQQQQQQQRRQQRRQQQQQQLRVA
jgi:GNAT superfamily N-acetyltransferase